PCADTRATGSFADYLFAIPGDPRAILYGRHAGDSTDGPAQLFYRVPLDGGRLSVVARGRDLAWSPDHHFFATGASWDLVALGPRRHVVVSPVSLVSLTTGRA